MAKKAEMVLCFTSQLETCEGRRKRVNRMRINRTEDERTLDMSTHATSSCHASCA